MVTEKGLEVETMRATGKPGVMILKAIESKAPNLVVIVKRDNYEHKSSFAESLTAHLGHYANCHLMVLNRNVLPST